MQAVGAAQVEAWTLELVERPSVNGTGDEADYAPWLAAWLRRLPLWAGAPEEVRLLPVPGDPLGRASVVALRRGRGKRTVVLTGHFDTVRIDDYGELAPLATRPAALRAALLQRLRAGATTPAERRALADLESGAFLPGRGLLDMKSGLAAGLAAMAAWAEAGEPEGNLLFVAVPDEEANSAGARSAMQALPVLAAELGLELEAAINLDCLVDDGDGAAGRRVTLGTVGKLLPSALVVGQPSHAAAALGGLNAAALMAAIVSEMEWAAALTDQVGGEAAAPPTLLGLGDHRPAYDVTMPERVWAYWNVMVLERRPEEVLASFAALCRRAVARALATLRERATALGGAAALPAEVPVVPFAELRAAAGPSLDDLARGLQGQGLDLPEQCRRITEAAWAASGRSAPAVIVGLASMPYLPTRLRGGQGARLGAAVERARMEVGTRHGVGIGTCGFFPGISDMSFLGQVDAAAVPAIAAATPAWGHGIAWPGGAAALGVPIVNAGPWGRDYHTPLERLHTAYAFEVLPDLLGRIVREVLAG